MSESDFDQPRDEAHDVVDGDVSPQRDEDEASSSQTDAPMSQADEPIVGHLPGPVEIPNPAVVAEPTTTEEFAAAQVEQLDASPAWAARELTGALIREDANGNKIIDTLAGRSSVLGLDCPEVIDAIRSAAEQYLGDASAFVELDAAVASNGLRELFADFFRSGTDDLTDSLFLTPSADLAVEQAITLARRHRPQKAFRTVALVGSDHGRTLLCRTASGRPELQEDLGPLVAGFSHVPIGDLDALDVAMDEQTACVLISPNLWSRGGEVLEASYLAEVRRLCDDRRALLVVDETQVVFGSTGHPLAISAITDVRPDVVAYSSGLFGGLPGGITLASQRVTGEECEQTGRYPLLATVLAATLGAMSQRDLLQSVGSVADALAVELAERVSRFEFVRDVHVLGLSIGLETDLDSKSLVRAASQRRVRLESAGETAVRMQPPLAMTEDDRCLLLDAVEETLSSIQLSTADLSV